MSTYQRSILSSAEVGIVNYSNIINKKHEVNFIMTLTVRLVSGHFGRHVRQRTSLSGQLPSMICHFHVVVNFPGQPKIEEDYITSDIEANVLVDGLIPLR